MIILSKLRYSLSDLAERNIDLQSLTYNSAAAQELFWEMMEQAENKYGFDFSNSHIVFEPLDDIRKGLIITVTKIDEDADLNFCIISKLNSERLILKLKRRHVKFYIRRELLFLQFTGRCYGVYKSFKSGV